MAQYEYRCRNEQCSSYGIITVFSYNDIDVRCHCNQPLKRKFSFQTKPVATIFTPHYNNAVGQYVRSYGEFTDVMHRNSDRESERTGMQHNFQPLHPTDMKPPTSEGIHEQARADHDRKIT